MSIKTTLDALKSEINIIKQEGCLVAQGLTILAASKEQPVAEIEKAMGAGLTAFGENRVQEAWDKWPGLKESHAVELHLIGPLQSNKARAAVELFDVIQTIDRESVVDAVAEAKSKTGRNVRCYVQVNTGKEPQKAGVFPEHAEALLTHCKNSGLEISGLMCIPPAHLPPSPHFALLRKIAIEHGLAELSMGMSEDYRTAIRMGSTCIRLGRLLFGDRPKKP